jgi:NAD(P)-dependent dehydrogenase (short-subunit alcohol dehydrogenase family)
MASTRTVVVTGANRGIGEAIAKQLREKGARVVPTGGFFRDERAIAW